MNKTDIREAKEVSKMNGKISFPRWGIQRGAEVLGYLIEQKSEQLVETKTQCTNTWLKLLNGRIVGKIGISSDKNQRAKKSGNSVDIRDIGPLLVISHRLSLV